jgi:hypothetical protein
MSGERRVLGLRLVVLAGVGFSKFRMSGKRRVLGLRFSSLSKSRV